MKRRYFLKSEKEPVWEVTQPLSESGLVKVLQDIRDSGDKYVKAYTLLCFTPDRGKARLLLEGSRSTDLKNSVLIPFSDFLEILEV